MLSNAHTQLLSLSWQDIHPHLQPRKRRRHAVNLYAGPEANVHHAAPRHLAVSLHC